MVESMFDDVQDMSQLPVEAFSPLVYRSGDVVEGEIVSIDSEQNTLLIKGGLPGPNGQLVRVIGKRNTES